MKVRFLRTALAALATSLLACGPSDQHEPLAAEGALYATQPGISRSPMYNGVACLTCHAVHPADVGTRLLPGAPLEGAARRPTFWGGETQSLHEAVSRCFTTFMRGDPTDLDGPTGAALYAWLEAISPGDASAPGSAAVPETFVPSVQDIPPGDPTRGGLLYHQTCSVCHGELHVGPVIGRLVSYIPDDTVRAHDVPGMCMPGMCGQFVREIVIEKVRHGAFLGYSGNMAPFSTQALSDARLGDILAYLNLPNN